MVAAFRERRDRLADRLADHGVELSVGDGAFYAMPRVADDDTAWCERAIEDAHVACVPGSAFGAPGYARLSYAASTDRLDEAVDRLADAGLI
jgi:aspartate aminotransferase